MPAGPRPPRRDGGGARKPSGGASRGGGAKKPPATRKAAPKQWGGVARRGTRNLESPKPGSAAAEFGKAAERAEQERAERRGPRTVDDDAWIDGGPVREQAERAVARGTSRPSRRKEVPAEVAEEVGRAAGPNWAARVTDRLNDAARAYQAERFRDARRILEPLLQRHPRA
jgi:hypothetical protein